MRTQTTRSVLRLLFIVLVLSSSTVATAQTNSSLPADKIKTIEAAISAFQSQRHIAALSIAIVADNKILFVGAYGIADLENSVPAKPTTVFRIASISKSLTAVAAMQLVEKGKLDLDAPVQKYVPSFPTKAFPVTTRQVLAHLSGIRHYRRDEGEYTNRYASLTDALRIFKDDPLEHEPETRYTYTTFGYTLLGAIIEGASGMNFTDYMRENIFKPAGMQHTQADDLYTLISNRARGYRPREYAQFNGNVRNMSLMDSSYKIPGGGFVSTAEDLARFAIAVMNNTLIKQETFEQMSRNQKTRDGKETGYAYGWYIDRREGRQSDGSVHHGGVQQGFTGDLWLLPKKRFAVAVLTNLEGGGRLGLALLGNQIADIVLAR